MSRLVFVRHGETWNNHSLRFQGIDDGPEAQLTEKGRGQALAVRDVLADIPFDGAWSSPLGRARETAEIILNGQDIPIRFDDRLREIDFGNLNGESFKDYFRARGRDRANWWEENWDVPYPGGESFEQLYRRLADFAEMCSQQGQDSILIVTHSTPVKLGLALMMQQDPKSFLPLYVPNCGVYDVQSADGQIWTWKPLYPPEAVEGFTP